MLVKLAVLHQIPPSLETHALCAKITPVYDIDFYWVNRHSGEATFAFNEPSEAEKHILSEREQRMHYGGYTVDEAIAIMKDSVDDPDRVRLTQLLK